MPSSRTASRPEDRAHVSYVSPALASGFFTPSATYLRIQTTLFNEDTKPA